MATENVMVKPYIEKLTLNIGVGEAGEALDRAEELLKRLTDRKPIRTKARRRIPTFGIRPGLPIGVKVTLRGQAAKDMLKRLLAARKNKIPKTSFDKTGQVSFGVKEYIDIPGIKYDPDLGMFGLDVSITISKPGFRVARRKRGRARVGKNQRVTPEEAMALMRDFGAELV